jgi:biopolymer transport protein ExbD
MRTLGPKRKIDEIPQASMSDVAFLLLIFFIVTTIFNTEKGIPLALPGKASATTQMNPKNILKLQSDANGNITMNDEPIALPTIATEIDKRLAENDKLVISIQSHAESTYQTMVSILDEVKKSRATRISLTLRRI